MEIIIIFDRMELVKRYMKDLFKTYQDKIVKYNRMQNKMILINGDIIKGYSVNSRLEGLRADAVVGIDDTYITCRSRLDNPNWTRVDLERHIGGVNT